MSECHLHTGSYLHCFHVRKIHELLLTETVWLGQLFLVSGAATV